MSQKTGWNEISQTRINCDIMDTSLLLDYCNPNNTAVVVMEDDAQNERETPSSS